MPVLEILGGWVIGSCTLGPLLAWVFFYPARRREDNRAMPNRYEGLDPVVCLWSRDLDRIWSDRIFPHSQPAPKAGLEASKHDERALLETAHR
jgi:hypothetical protein